MSFRGFASALISAVIAAAIVAMPAHGHQPGYDHPSYFETWYLDIPFGEFENAIVNGALVWDNVSNQSHDFQRIFYATAQIRVDRNTIDGPGGRIAWTTAEHNHIRIDSAENWHLDVYTYPAWNEWDLWSVAAHEFGHTLSLIESTNPADTMYWAFTTGDWWPRSLESNDMTRIRNLYGGGGGCGAASESFVPPC